MRVLACGIYDLRTWPVWAVFLKSVTEEEQQRKIERRRRKKEGT